MRIDIDVSTLTLGEVEFFEAESGVSFEDLSQGRVNTRALMALIVVQQRRTDPSYGMDDARKITVSEVDVSGLTDPRAPKRRAKAAS